MAISYSAANHIAEHALLFYLKGPALSQTMQDKPLLKWLNAGKKTFPGGKDQISLPVQGTYMEDTAGFLQGLGEAEQLTFAQADNLRRVVYNWYVVQMSFIISWYELLVDGISVGNNNKTSQHSGVEITRLTGILENKLDDYMESMSRAMNKMFWQDGSQDSQQVPGVLSLLKDTPATGTTGGLSRVDNTWWRHLVNLSLVPDGDAQSIMRYLNAQVLQLRRYGGKPNKNLCGSDFLAALRQELVAKGQYTQTGYTGSNDMGIGTISLTGLGTFEYDPTLDDLNLSKRCYCMDGRRLVLRPIEGEDMKPLMPERPYDYLVFLKTTTWSGGLTVNQLNCHGVYAIA